MNKAINAVNSVLVFAVSSAIVLIIFYAYLPPAGDWRHTFYQVARSPLTPFNVRTFINPPWLGLLLAPLGFLPVRVGQAINAYLNLLLLELLIYRYGGGRIALILGITSFPFLALMITGDIEWVAMAGYLIKGVWGAFILLTKPQSGILSALIWFKVSPNKKQFVIILFLVLSISVAVLGAWPIDLLENVNYVERNYRMMVTGISLLGPGAFRLVFIYFIKRGNDRMIC